MIPLDCKRSPVGKQHQAKHASVHVRCASPASKWQIRKEAPSEQLSKLAFTLRAPTFSHGCQGRRMNALSYCPACQNRNLEIEMLLSAWRQKSTMRLSSRPLKLMFIVVSFYRTLLLPIGLSGQVNNLQEMDMAVEDPMARQALGPWLPPNRGNHSLPSVGSPVVSQHQGRRAGGESVKASPVSAPLAIDWPTAP